MSGTTDFNKGRASICIKSHRGDIFRYLNQKSGDKRIYHTQKDIATAVGKAFYITIDKSGINRISKGKAKGRKEFGMKRIDAFFDELFPGVHPVKRTTK